MSASCYQAWLEDNSASYANTCHEISSPFITLSYVHLSDQHGVLHYDASHLSL